MKKVTYIFYILILFLASCSTTKQVTQKGDIISLQTENKEIVEQKKVENKSIGANIEGITTENLTSNLEWKIIGPSVPSKDFHEKFSAHTETYWLGEGQISAIWMDEKDDNHILIGVAFGGLFETFDGGENWKPLTDKIPVHHIQKISVRGGVIYISTGYRFKNPLRFSTVKREFYGLGVVNSKDGGKTWHLPKTNFYCGDFSDSKYHNTIYAISTSTVYKSINNGDSFTQSANLLKTDLSKINDKVELQNVVVHPQNPDIAYVTGKRGEDKNAKVFFKTTNGGKTWVNVLDNLEQFIKQAPKNSTGHYIKDASLFFNEKNNKLWLHYSVAFEFENKRSKRKKIMMHSYILNSTDFNNFNFVTTQEIHGGNHYSPKIYEKEETLYLLAWYLQIKGLSDSKFVNVGRSKVHQDCRAVGVDSKGTIYYGNDAGIVKSTDKGETWTNAYYNLNANLINEMSYYSNKTERRLDIGTQDDGYYRNNLDGLPRYPIGTHEGGIYTSPHNKDRIYIKDRTVSLSIDGGKKFNGLKLNDGKPVKIMHDDGMLIEDPIDSNTLYVGHLNNVFVSNRLGEKGTWENITPKNGNNGRSVDLAIPKSNTNILYLANKNVSYPIRKAAVSTYIMQGQLIKSTDKGLNWKKISTQFDELLKNSEISDVEVDDENPNRVWFTLRNLTKGKKVFYSDDGGKSWKNISYNLPNVPANRIEYNQQSKLLILANDYGVYYLDNNSWQEYGINLPKVIITSMVLDHNFNEIIVSTFGRGVWRTGLK